MSANAVTYNSTAPRRIRFPANQPGGPVKAPTPLKFPQVIKPPKKVQDDKSLKKLLKKLVPAFRKFPQRFGVAGAAIFFIVERVMPAHWPGWDNITVGWRNPAQFPLGYSIGDWVPNPFDVCGGYNASCVALLDTSTCALPNGCRFWGDFPNAEPETDPYAPKILPEILFPNPSAAPQAQPQPRYSPLPNLAPKPHPRLRGRRNHRNVYIEIPLRGHNARKGVDNVIIGNNFPNIKANDTKATPKNILAYAIMKEVANALGETKEWIDILAEAAGYQKFDPIHPKTLFGRETAKKAFWLFALGGFNQIDTERLFELAVENEIEDYLIGLAGRASKSAARGLGLTVGPQTGLAM